MKNNDKSKIGKGAPLTNGKKGNFPGINRPDIALPAFNPPVPNRAWTEMKREIEGGLSEDERLDVIYGEDDFV